jgi:hypothetical protein
MRQGNGQRIGWGSDVSVAKAALKAAFRNRRQWYLIVSTMAVCLGSGIPAPAQLVDIQSVRCSGWLASSASSRSHLIAWLDGYFIGLRQGSSFDSTRLQSNLGQIIARCQANPDARLIQAWRTAFSIASFGCDANVGDVCNFALYPNAASTTPRRFSIDGHGRRLIDNVSYATNVYCICINSSPPNTYNLCTNPDPSHFCKRVPISDDFNN